MRDGPKNEGPAMPDPARGARPAGDGVAAALLPGTRPAAPGASRHETGPSTTFERHPPTITSRAKIKPQVDGLRFSPNIGYGRGAGAKRSRWAGSVAEIIPGTRPEAFGSEKTVF